MSAQICNNYFCTERIGDVFQIGICGQWTIHHIGKIKKALETLEGIEDGCVIHFKCTGLRNIDTSGAWVLYKEYQKFIQRGFESQFQGFQEKHFRIVTAVFNTPKECSPDVVFVISLKEMLIRLGRKTYDGCSHMMAALCFLMRLFVTFGRVLSSPKRLRLTSIVRHVHETGLNAIPIVAMIAFLFSIVLSYQGVVQLRNFGADVFMVNLTAASVLREIGVLMTAILVAGRSGSAYAAEIGVMKIREEVDALNTMGVDIFEMLIIPRVIGLVIALPLLTIIANIVGLSGGAFMAFLLIDMPLNMYMDRVLEAVGLGSFWVGIIKAPFFAVIIATVGTFRGLQVSGAADSIGRFTTLAVVQSIFLIIVADAIFTIIFEKMGM